MGRADFYKPGDYNIICDRTGFKIKRSWARKEWNNRIVRAESFEQRHPQDFLRSKVDRQTVADPRTEAADDLIGVNEGLNEHVDPDTGSASAVATPDGGNTGDGSITGLTADLSADTSGNYTVLIQRVTRAAADAQDPGDTGKFLVTDPQGDFVGEGEIGVQFAIEPFCFTVKENGSVAFAVGDKFTIAVT